LTGKRRFGKGTRHRSFPDFILIALMKEGPQGIADLERRLRELQAHFVLPARSFGDWVAEGFAGKRRPTRPWNTRPEHEADALPDVAKECEALVARGFVVKDAEGKCSLTDSGRAEAEKFEKELTHAADVVQRRFLSPEGAARNTVIVDLVLAIIKLLAGLLSQSVALLADGADAAIDTASACVVWVGLKFQKEVLGTLMIVSMMFLTAAGIGWESAGKIIAAATGATAPIARPYLVIAVESFAMVAAAILFLYQRFVGRRHGSLPLISQSIDSKNHIYVAAAVIGGSVSSMLGIYLVDPIVGGLVAAKILIDGIGLLREAIGSIRGEELDLSKYRLPLEEQWQRGKIQTFQTWVLFTMTEDGLNSRSEIIRSLEETFERAYVPVLSEFDYRLGRDVDFDREFDGLVGPLVESGLIRREDGAMHITEKGSRVTRNLTRNLRYQAGRHLMGGHGQRKPFRKE
jgi:divalent metal cation (Fe/Co/Zn/Cd) transporter